MMGNWLKQMKGMLRLSRAERALTLAIFLLFQAMLPSYAGALSEWSGEDRLVLCTAHGLIAVDPSDRSETVLHGALRNPLYSFVCADGLDDRVLPETTDFEFAPHRVSVAFGGWHFLHCRCRAVQHRQRARQSCHISCFYDLLLKNFVLFASFQLLIKPFLPYFALREKEDG